jgi:hypothetical protein
VDALDAELLELEAPAVPCRRCSHGFPEHADAGGHCTGRFGGWSSPADGVPCMCPGFLWVDPGGPAVGSYLEAPQR